MKNENKIIHKRVKGIQSYVDYLLGDIQQSERNEDVSSNALTDQDGLFEHFMEVERFVTEDPLNNLGQLCGLKREQFPPLDQLSKTQIKKIVKAFRRLLYSWNLEIVVPKKFPEVEQYDLLVGLLDQKVHIVKNGTYYIEFCSYEPKECPFGLYCDCKDFLDVNPPKKKRSGKTKSSLQ